MRFKDWLQLQEDDTATAAMYRDKDILGSIHQAGYRNALAYGSEKAVAGIAGAINKAAAESGATGQVSGVAGYMPGRELDPYKKAGNYEYGTVYVPMDKVYDYKAKKLISNYKEIALDYAFNDYAKINYRNDPSGVERTRTYFGYGKGAKVIPMAPGTSVYTFSIALLRSPNASTGILDPNKWSDDPSYALSA